jgi:hypothetical protein
MKPPIKRVASTDSLSEQGTDGTATTTTSTTSTENLFLCHIQTDSQLQSQMVYLRHYKILVQRKSSSPRHGLIPEHLCLYPPRRYANLFSVLSRPHSLTALHRGHPPTQIRRDRARDDIRLLVYPGIPLTIGRATSSSAHTTL